MHRTRLQYRRADRLGGRQKFPQAIPRRQRTRQERQRRAAQRGTPTDPTGQPAPHALNLSIWFAWHALRPESGGIDWLVAVLALAAWVAMERFKIGVIPVLGACALAGLIRFTV